MLSSLVTHSIRWNRDSTDPQASRVNINKEDDAGYTSLHLAVKNDQLNIVAVLLGNGATVSKVYTIVLFLICLFSNGGS